MLSGRDGVLLALATGGADLVALQSFQGMAMSFKKVVPAEQTGGANRNKVSFSPDGVPALTHEWKRHDACLGNERREFRRCGWRVG